MFKMIVGAIATIIAPMVFCVGLVTNISTMALFGLAVWLFLSWLIAALWSFRPAWRWAIIKLAQSEGVTPQETRAKRVKAGADYQ